MPVLIVTNLLVFALCKLEEVSPLEIHPPHLGKTDIFLYVVDKYCLEAVLFISMSNLSVSFYLSVCMSIVLFVSFYLSM